MKAKSVFQIKAVLRDTKPPVWRRVLVPSTITLGELHEVMQAAFGWWNCHLHEWEVNGVEYGIADVDFEDWKDEPVNDERKVRLADVAGEGTKLAYWYDFGDDWRHQLVVEKILSAKADVSYPQIVAGRRACPPEDVGGTWGYENFLRAIGDPDDEEHDELLEWVGGSFDPTDAKLDGFHDRLAEQAAARTHVASIGGGLAESPCACGPHPLGVRAAVGPSAWSGGGLVWDVGGGECGVEGLEVGGDDDLAILLLGVLAVAAAPALGADVADHFDLGAVGELVLGDQRLGAEGLDLDILWTPQIRVVAGGDGEQRDRLLVVCCRLDDVGLAGQGSDQLDGVHGMASWEVVVGCYAEPIAVGRARRRRPHPTNRRAEGWPTRRASSERGSKAQQQPRRPHKGTHIARTRQGRSNRANRLRADRIAPAHRA